MFLPGSLEFKRACLLRVACVQHTGDTLMFLWPPVVLKTMYVRGHHGWAEFKIAGLAVVLARVRPAYNTYS